MLLPDIIVRLQPPKLPQDKPGEVYQWNPTLLALDEGYLCAYRYVEDGARHIRTLRLDTQFQPVGAPVPVSEILKQQGSPISWFADPRLFLWRGRPHMSFNTGHSEVPNSNYVVELTDDGQPVGPVLTLVKEHGQRRIEKNWGLFDHEGTLYAVYALSPFTILRCDMEGDNLVARPVYTHHWLSSQIEVPFGRLHGGACPVRVADSFYLVNQSNTRGPAGKNYRGGILTFDAMPPFAPQLASAEPLFELTDDEKALFPQQRLTNDTEAVLYPAGAALTPDAKLAISYGINDFTSGLRTYDLQALTAQLLPVQRLTENKVMGGTMGEEVRAFIWQPAINIHRTLPDLEKSIFRSGNVGDALNENIIAHLYARPAVHSELAGSRFLGIGSIGHRVLPGDIVWGTGFKDRAPDIVPDLRATVDIRAVRGPRTLDYFNRHGFDVSRVQNFFDPGLIIGELFADEIALLQENAPASRRIVAVPHYKVASRIQPTDDMEVLQPDHTLFGFLAGMVGAELVLSSSLHGIIFAEALGIPAILLRPPVDEAITKYEDYYEGSGRTSFPILDNTADYASVTPPDLPKLKVADWLACAPTFEDLKQKNIVQPVAPVVSEISNAAVPPIVRAGAGQQVTTTALRTSHFAGEVFKLGLKFLATGPVSIVIATRSAVLAEGQFQAGEHVATIQLDGGTIERTSQGILYVHFIGSRDARAHLLQYGPVS